MKSKFFAIIFMALSLFVLNACTSIQGEKNFEKMTYEQRIEMLKTVNKLEENGRIAIMPNKGRSFAVNCTYSYTPQAYSIEFLGPMGMQYAKVDVYANGTTFLNIRGDVYKGDNARELLKKQFNLDLPVEQIPAIMFGTPKGELTFDEKGFVKTAKFNEEYQVNYKDYRAFRGVVLPKGIEIITPIAKVEFRVNDVTTLN